MDPFAAIGLVGNLITFLEFGFTVISKANDIRNSTSGTSSANNALASMTKRLQDVTLSLPGDNSSASLSSQHESLARLGIECQQISEELLNLLEKLRAKNPSSKRSTLRAALREMTGSKKEEVHELEKRLDRCRQQLNLELVSLSRSECFERLQELTNHGLSTQTELASLSKNVQSLRSGIHVKSLDQSAIEQISSIVNLSSEAIKKVRESRILEAVRFELMDERFHDVKEPHEETFDWIFHSQTSSIKIRSGEDQTPGDDEHWHTVEEARLSFCAWLEHGDGIFHISGKPGAGKSTLMKFLCRSPSTQDLLNIWARDKVLVLGHFFFWRPGTELQKSLSGLIRGLLYCLLSNCPDLIPIALPKQWEQSHAQEKFHLDPEQIRTAFNNATLAGGEPRFRHKFAIFIDGLDEFTGNHAELIQQLFHWTRRNEDIKICVSSREWTIFQVKFNDVPKMKLHYLTRSDIVKVVRERLKDAEMVSMLRESGCNSEELEKSIVDNSDGVFLWVSIVLHMIEDGLMNGDVMTDLQRKIGSLPTELEKMFQHLFDSISTADEKLAYLILNMVLLLYETNNGQCCLSRYSFLEDYLVDQDFAIKMPAVPFTRSLIASRLKRAQRRVYGICKGFLELVPYSAEGDEILPTFTDSFEKESRRSQAEHEVSQLFGGAVKFTHRSIVEFLHGKAIRKRVEQTIVDIDTFDACCQSLLAQTKAISTHQPSLCFPDPASFIEWAYNDFRRGVDLIRLPQPHTVRSKSIPAWFSDDLIDVAQIAATKETVDMLRFENFIADTTKAAATFDLEPRRFQLIDANMRDFRCEREFDLDISVIPSLAVVIAGPPLSRITINPAIDLWMLLSMMEEITLFGNARQASTALHNLRYYLAMHATQNESSIIPRVPRWHFFLWKSCWSYPNLAVIALFLYYGANPSFWIKAALVKEAQVCYGETTGDIRFWFESGAGRAQGPGIQQITQVEGPLSPVRDGSSYSHWRRAVEHVSSSYLEFWQRYNYKLSLRELVGLWFPMHAKKLQEVIDWLEEQGSEISQEEGRELQDKFGVYLRSLFEIDTIVGWQCAGDISNVTDMTVESFGSMVPGEVFYSGT